MSMTCDNCARCTSDGRLAGNSIISFLQNDKRNINYINIVKRLTRYCIRTVDGVRRTLHRTSVCTYAPRYYNGSVSTGSLLASVSIILCYACRVFQSTARKFPGRLQRFSVYENYVLAVVNGNRNNYRRLARVCRRSILIKQRERPMSVYRSKERAASPTRIAFRNFEHK